MEEKETELHNLRNIWLSSAAVAHVAEMDSLYGKEIWKSVAKTEVYTQLGDSYLPRQVRSPENGRHLTVVKGRTEQFVFTLADDAKVGKKITVLNFANPLEPGGGYIYGAMAQEESLCSKSTLYNVLSGIYSDRDELFYQRNFTLYPPREIEYPSHQLMWNPGIVFREKSGREVRVDVITAYAPCVSRVKYGNGEKSEEELIKVCGEILKKRFMEVMDLAEQKGTDIFITGPFGCGEFGNHIRYILEAHREGVPLHSFDVVAVVPDFRYYTEFERLFQGLLTG